MGSLRIFEHVISSFFGGFSLNRSCRSDTVRIIFFVLLIVFFETFFYLKTSRNTKLIACGILMIIVFLIKLVLYLFHLMLNTALDLSNSEPSIKEERPEDIPQEVWETRSLLKNPKPNLDSVVSDLIASGIDANGLIRLVDYIQNAPESPVEELSSEEDQNPVINICGRLHTLPFSRYTVEKIFPTNFSFSVLFFSAVFGFSCCYLPLSLFDQLRNREKWWVAIECAFSIFSILRPPEVDPYLTFTPDSWTGLSRPLGITIICTIWRVTIDAENENPISHLPFYDIEINWTSAFPYIYDICRYGLLLLPFWIVIGFIGHPVSTIISILESACRYLFGQNGVKNVLHLVIQIARGAISVACCWALLQYRKNEITMSLSITVSTFLGCLPIYFKKSQMKSVFVSFLYPVILTATSFISSYCLCFLLISDKSNEALKQEIILWFSSSWFILFDLIIPYFNSNHQYYIFHCRLLVYNRLTILFRDLSQIIVGPLFLASCLLHSHLHPLLIAFIIVHATQKYSTEPHIFALAVFIVVVTLPYDFDKNNDYTANLLIALLVVSKIEIFYPQVQLVYRSRDYFNLISVFEDFENLSFIYTIISPIIHSFPLNDFVLKIPALFWSFFTGCSFTAVQGFCYLLAPSPPRCFYFFDWPVVNEGGSEKVSFTKHVSEHPIETPVYTSTARALSKDFATIARSGRLGYICSGDIFLFKSESLAAFVHVISQEPSAIRIQVRGLEYDQQTTCHRGENGRLNEIINNYSLFPNFFAASASLNCVYDIRALGIPLQMFDVSQTKIDQAFVGLSAKQTYEMFLVSFAYTIATRKEKLFEVRPVSSEDEESVRPFRTSNLMSKIRTIASKRLNNGNIGITNNNTTTAVLNNNNENNENSLNENDSALNDEAEAEVEIDGGNEGEFDDEEANLAVNLWLVIAMTLFNGDNLNLKTDIIVDSFKGSPPFNEHQTWIYNSPTLLVEVIVPSIQLGCTAAFIASADGSIDFDENEEVNADDAVSFLDNLKQSTVMTTLESNRFQKAFFSESNRTIISMDTIQRESTVIRFVMTNKRWDVFQMKHEWIRALWSNDEKNIIFYSQQDNERISIQHNDVLLNNMIMQAADIPVGYPAYTSEIIDSYTNPLSIESFE
ncbi:Pecanex-like protein 4 [Tritrichomonas musculus]|uniref:Pecanex-like protein 4 n=1 Tax=Tritrichomonas musculus TaxID=1915356 RepID=A0ABR2KZ95_9EUKA